jgi:hypothetical protein
VSSTVPFAINTVGSATVGTWTALPVGRHNFAGDLGDVLVYDRALSTTERTAVETYLQQKYSGALSPDALPNLVLWLDADTITGVPDGGEIAHWPDTSGAGHAAGQSVPAWRPALQTSGFNGHPVARFDGVDDFLTIPNTIIAGSTARTLLVVARPNTVGNVGFVDLGNGTTPGGAFLLTPEYGVRISGGNRLYQGTAPTGVPAIYTVSSNGPSSTNVVAWANGTSLAPASTVAASINTVGPAVIGTFTALPIGRHNLTGDIAEIVAYSRALSAAERQAVEHYLATKYGIALP